MTFYERVNHGGNKQLIDVNDVIAALRGVGYDTQIVPSESLLAQEQELSEYVATLADLFYGESTGGLTYA